MAPLKRDKVSSWSLGRALFSNSTFKMEIVLYMLLVLYRAITFVQTVNSKFVAFLSSIAGAKDDDVALSYASH